MILKKALFPISLLFQPVARHFQPTDRPRAAISTLWILSIGAIALFAAGCSDDDNGMAPTPTAGCSLSGPVEEFDVVGSWGVTSIEGSPVPVAPENSIWTFHEDGTYDWFLDLAQFDAQGSGTYTYNGGSLSLTGVIVDKDVVSGNTVVLGLVQGNVAFFFRDADGDEWVYEKCE